MPRFKKIIEKRGTPREDLVDYFISIGGELANDGVYIGDKWKVEIGKEHFYYIGQMSIKSVKITFYIDEEFFDEMLYSFRLKFLSAGG